MLAIWGGRAQLVDGWLRPLSIFPLQAARKEASAAIGIELLTGLTAVAGDRGAITYTDASTGFSFVLRPRTGETDREEDESDSDDEFTEPLVYMPTQLGSLGSFLPEHFTDELVFERSKACHVVPKLLAAINQARKSRQNN